MKPTRVHPSMDGLLRANTSRAETTTTSSRVWRNHNTEIRQHLRTTGGDLGTRGLVGIVGVPVGALLVDFLVRTEAVAGELS